MKKIFVAFALVILFSGFVSASIIATIGMRGLSFVNPELAGIISTAVSTYECITTAGLVGCGSLIVQSKVVGYISGKALQAIAEASPEAAKAIITYNQVQSYIDTGAKIIEELEVNENGNINRGLIDLSGEEYSLKDFFENLTAEDIVVSNATYDFDSKTITIKEDGFIKLKTKDKEGNVIELVYENIKSGGLFKLNENGTIEEADFFSSKDDSTYKFGDNEEIKVEADTKIIYKDGVVRIIGKNKNFFYGDSNIKLNKAYVDLVGNKISCLDCKVGEIELRAVESGLGLLTITDKGYFLNRGVADYEKIRLTAENEGSSVLIANLGEDLSSYNKNWVKISDKNLEINSVVKKQINLEVLPGNKLLNTFQFQVKRDDEGELVFENNKLIPEIVSDERDNLKFELANGDNLKIISREDKDKIPLVIHNPSESGSTYIENGRLPFRIENGELKVGIPKTLEESLLTEGVKFESVAFQLKTPALNDYELRVNSGNMYEILSPDKADSQITFNSKGFRLSDSIDDNLYPQTLDYLRMKYPDITFYFSSGEGDVYTEPSPQLTQLLNQWFEEDPRRVDFFKEVAFTEVFNSAAGYKYLMLGEKAYDLYATEQIRDIDSPLQILTHEFEHEMDFHISYSEEKRLKDFSRTDKTARELLRRAKEADAITDLYYWAEDYHRPNIFDNALLSEEESSLSKLEINQKRILEYQNEIKEAEQELYSVLSESSEFEYVKNKLDEVSSMNQRRQELYDFIFDPKTKMLSLTKGDSSLREIASLTTSIDTELEDLKIDLEGRGKEVVDSVSKIKTLYYYTDEKPTTGIEARIDWREEGSFAFYNRKAELIGEAPYLKEKFEEYIANNPKTKKLEHIYGETVIDTSYNIIHDKKMKLIRNKAALELKKKLITDYGVDFGEYRNNLKDFVQEDYFYSLSSDDQELLLINHAAFKLEEDAEYFDERLDRYVSNPEFKFLKDLAGDLNKLSDELIETYTKEATIDPYSEEGLPPLRDMFELEFLLKSKRLEDNSAFAQLSDELVELYEGDYGIPASYGFHNYGEKNKKYAGRYSEIASTYREQPIKVKRFKIHKGTMGQKSMFKLLTQLAFDAGKMDIDEYTKLMGQDTDNDGLGDLFCQTKNCIEYRCVKYKSLCCLQHPGSPNC